MFKDNSHRSQSKLHTSWHRTSLALKLIHLKEKKDNSEIQIDNKLNTICNG